MIEIDEGNAIFISSHASCFGHCKESLIVGTTCWEITISEIFMTYRTTENDAWKALTIRHSLTKFRDHFSKILLMILRLGIEGFVIAKHRDDNVSTNLLEILGHGSKSTRTRIFVRAISSEAHMSKFKFHPRGDRLD